MRILIIDDEDDTRSICSMSLGLLGGADVLEASCGTDGIDVAVKEKPDVIILDLLMPEMDGTQTFLHLKSNPRTEKIPVIFMTVKGMFSEFDSLKSLGALAVIAKPFDPTTLTQSIKSILKANGFSTSEANSEASELSQDSLVLENAKTCGANGQKGFEDAFFEKTASVSDSKKAKSSRLALFAATSSSRKSAKLSKLCSVRPTPVTEKILALKKKQKKKGEARFRR